MRVMEQTKPYIVTTTGGYGKNNDIKFSGYKFYPQCRSVFKQKEDGENNTSSAKFTVTIM